ncbi:hypothetical protein Pelo_7587 [Pelomyxa schiedti]|nr:hypothetical protein Pelo_7587 [Pelomyxa schiedti]
MDENSVAKKATLTCSRCKGLLFCESCFNIHHQAPGIKSHKGDPITTTSPLVDVYHQCPKHPTKDLDMFCLEENEPICYLCHVSSLHSTHKCVPLDEACSMIRESILGSISKLEETVALENEAIRTCDDSVLKTEQLLQSIASNVATELASICQTMRQKVSEVSADCNSLSSLIRSHVKEHKECLEVCMSTHQRTITRAHEIVKYSDVVSLIAADKKLKETVWECTQLVASGAMKPCLSATHITHHINIPALKEVLDNNFVSVQYRTSHQQAPHNEESCSELRVQLARKQEQIAVLNTELERKQRQIEVLTSQLQYSSLRMGGTTATNQFLSAEVARLRAEALNRIKLPAKVVSSCKHFMDYRPQNTLIEDSTVFAVPPIATCAAEEISIVYDLHAEQTVSKFLLKNRGTDAQVVKTFSLWGAHKKTGPWTVVLDHAHANLNPDIGEFKIAGNVPKFRFWKLQFLENNGSTSSQQCLFVLEYVAFIG